VSTPQAEPPPISSEPPSTDGPCSGTVTFHMTATGAPWWFNFSGDEEPNWLSLAANNGDAMAKSPSEANLLDCTTCEGGWAVPIGFSRSELGPKGATQSWDGAYFDPGTCGASRSCATLRCAVPGHYVARMCACQSIPPDGDCTNPESDGVICLDVPFDYPAQATIAGNLQP
jgi:hypothetical protein